ncbi:hypothetical protein J7I80_05970 [Bacillus sp. ISL-41]|uniref:immunoglobulin-like domain-containing protein n=1 Tax=Bacillus sp. ISL-41 TaxID=2819127 RepID=UPI001BED13CE|nr:immunoglobulin-like domain-containing protein [Bacillus sp. ISL-41]MBT2641762.1 hypothetical protein [Bacillus sp. ISL-41]
MKRFTILLAGMLLLTACEPYQETISQHSNKEISAASVQKNKSKYGELTNEDKEIVMAGEMYLMLPPPPIENLGISNNGSQTYLVSPEFMIEKLHDGAWYEMPLPEGTDFVGKTAYIGPGGRYHQKINNVFDKKYYTNGKYRLIKVLKPKEKGQKDVVLALTLTIDG